MVFTLVVHLYAKEGAEVEQKLRTKLTECSRVYSKDKETISWVVLQDDKDPRAWCLVERYVRQSSLKEHAENPYFKTFAPDVGPLLEKPIEELNIQMFNEIDT
ncbi:hypothetical protein DFH07DRAFT_860530 [Mycena maculata]|uniref:ABM domain-containing protein n=1 Tax=Mycena maculata TaxID=230809 RepID=A0AAD7MHU6_9AGAR|nr:hypothetical protein DFH07DRAFT_860530 [Mycena maculata]